MHSQSKKTGLPTIRRKKSNNVMNTNESLILLIDDKSVVDELLYLLY